MPCGKKLRILLTEHAIVHWSFDNWITSHDDETKDSGWSLEHLDLPTEKLTVGQLILFTFFWKNSGRWEERDFSVTIE